MAATFLWLHQISAEIELAAYSSDRGQRFHSDGGHHSTLMADSFSHALGPLLSMS
jgi:hypothetical protein